MARIRTIKYWKFLVHAICITLIGRSINESSVNYVSVIKVERFIPDLKHILIWTSMHGVSDEGQQHFIKKKCSKINCYFSKNRTLFGDIRYYDAIVFNLQDLGRGNEKPLVRGLNQKYIFAANDSADKYPVCDASYDDFFNWTWTYRIDSTIKYKFISAFNIDAQELGSHFPWINQMDPIDRNFQSLLTSKSRAAAVFLDNCKTRSKREDLVSSLQKELSRYNLTIDIFGKCGSKKCKRKFMGSCAWKLKKQYFFLLAFEDSFAKDYVTDVVLPAYHNNAVPIVYGGADYSKFLPPGSYINAVELSIPDLATSMYAIIQDRSLYYDFFKWRNHYSVLESKVLDACVLCEKLNQPAWLVERSSFNQLREWWLPDYKERCKGNWFYS